MTPAGLILINKATDITSFRALYPIKRHIHKKVGHTGTLDKFAEGLLIALIGPMTRMNSFFTDFDKVYEAVFHFGVRTTTLDPEGEIIEEGPVPTLEEISAVVSEFTGSIEQVPPQFSAVHVNGVRAYKSALAGSDVVIAPRTISIYRFEILSYHAPELQVRIHCSKGTYIRSLARDLGIRLGTCAYVTALRRTHIGPFSLSDAVDPETATIEDVVPPWQMFEASGALSICMIEDPVYIQRVRYGHMISRAWCTSLELKPDAGLCAVFTTAHELLAVVHYKMQMHEAVFTRYKFVIGEEEGGR
jgi:tRNA pseudouridine55 synthase